MGSQQPRPSWFRFPFRFRPASPPPVPAPAPASPITQPSAPRAPPSPQPQPALVRPAPPPVASPPPPPPPAAAAPAAPNTQPSPPAPHTPPSPRPLPTWVRPAPPPVASPPPIVAPAPVPSPVPSVPRFQTATPASRSPVAPSTAPPRSPIPPPPAPAPVASPPAAVAPISPATPAPLPPSISRSPVTASPPPRSTAASPTKSPIVKTSASLPPSPAPEESRKTWTNVPFSSSGPAPPKTKEQVPSSSMRTPVLQKSKLHSPTPIARNASATGSPPEVVKLLERTSVQSTPIKHVSRPPSPSMLSLPQPKTATDHEPKITVISNGRREPTKDKHSESEEYRMRVIKLAGQNKGAVMELRASGPQSLDKNGEIKTWRNVEKSSTVEGKSVEDKTCDEMFMESPEMTAFMNSNVQGINNSIFYNCSSTHNDPGIHLSLPRKNDKRREWD